MDGTIRSVSPALLNATGGNEQDWIGNHFTHLLHKGESIRVERLYEKAIGGESIQLGTLRYVATDGDYADFNSSFVPRIEGGKVVDILWLSHAPSDENARIESHLPKVLSLHREQASDSNFLAGEQAGLLGLLQTLLANAPVGVALFDEELKFICLNQTFSQMTGLSPAQQLGQPLLEVMPRVGLQIEPALRKVLLNGHPVTDHEIALQKFPLSEQSRWGLLSFYPVPDGHGENCVVAIIAVDITDRKRAEKALRESEDRFRLAVDATKLGTWDLNFHTGKMIWSDREKAIFGLPTEVTVNHKSFVTWLHPEDYQRVREAIERAKDPKGGGDYQIEYRVVGAKDGLLRWVSSRGKVSFSETGTPLRFVGTSLDVTEQKRAEEALKKLSDELARSNRALDDFAQIASHDLKEPLRMVSSFSQLLSSGYKGKLDATADEYLEFIRTGSKRMGHLIDSILEYARAGRRELKFPKVDCAAVIETALENLKAAREEGHVEITYDSLPAVLGNEDLILQVFQNLIANAIKFRAEVRPKIHIGVKADGDKWCFSVSDNGIGIDSDFIDAIFSPFRRLHSQESYAGSGLGLSICKQNVERHGGTIRATSERGKGTNFYFTLPSVA